MLRWDAPAPLPEPGRAQGTSLPLAAVREQILIRLLAHLPPVVLSIALLFLLLLGRILLRSARILSAAIPVLLLPLPAHPLQALLPLRLPLPPLALHGRLLPLAPLRPEPQLCLLPRQQLLHLRLRLMDWNRAGSAGGSTQSPTESTRSPESTQSPIESTWTPARAPEAP